MFGIQIPNVYRGFTVFPTCLAAVSVFRMDKAKAMAPLNPVRNNMCWRFMVILCFRPKFKRKDKG